MVRSEQTISRQRPDLVQTTIDRLLEMRVVAHLTNQRSRVQMHHGKANADLKLVDLAILLSEEIDRSNGQVPVYSVDVTEEWHSRRARDGDSHGRNVVE